MAFLPIVFAVQQLHLLFNSQICCLTIIYIVMQFQRQLYLLSNNYTPAVQQLYLLLDNYIYTHMFSNNSVSYNCCPTFTSGVQPFQLWLHYTLTVNGQQHAVAYTHMHVQTLPPLLQSHLLTMTMYIGNIQNPRKS